MKYVVDCSVAFMWVVPEPLSPKADKLREGFLKHLHELLAPDLFPTEVANALVVAERRGRILPGQSTILFADVATTMPSIQASYPGAISRAQAKAATWTEPTRVGEATPKASKGRWKPAADHPWRRGR